MIEEQSPKKSQALNILKQKTQEVKQLTNLIASQRAQIQELSNEVNKLLEQRLKGAIKPKADYTRESHVRASNPNLASLTHSQQQANADISSIRKQIAEIRKSQPDPVVFQVNSIHSRLDEIDADIDKVKHEQDLLKQILAQNELSIEGYQTDPHLLRFRDRDQENQKLKKSIRDAQKHFKEFQNELVRIDAYVREMEHRRNKVRSPIKEQLTVHKNEIKTMVSEINFILQSAKTVETEQLKDKNRLYKLIELEQGLRKQMEKEYSQTMNTHLRNQIEINKLKRLADIELDSPLKSQTFHNRHKERGRTLSEANLMGLTSPINEPSMSRGLPSLKRSTVPSISITIGTWNDMTLRESSINLSNRVKSILIYVKEHCIVAVFPIYIGKSVERPTINGALQHQVELSEVKKIRYSGQSLFLGIETVEGRITQFGSITSTPKIFNLSGYQLSDIICQRASRSDKLEAFRLFFIQRQETVPETNPTKTVTKVARSLSKLRPSGLLSEPRIDHRLLLNNKKTG